VRLHVGGSGSGRAVGCADVKKERLDDVEVCDLSTAEGRELEPDNEDGLEGEVPRDIVKNDTEGE